MRYISADYIVPVSSDIINNGVVQVDEIGTIVKIGPKADFPSVDIEHFSGIVLPGFINTHCHLELSHMKGLCKTGTTLIPFITDVVKFRDFEEEIVLAKIKEEDENMYAAIDALVDKLDRQVKKHKEKITKHHNKHSHADFPVEEL